MRAKTKEAPSLDALIEAAVARAMTPVAEELRAFVDRRLSEVSAEINAAVQIVDFSEAAISGQLAGIQDQVSRVLAQPEGAPHNSGIELEAIICETERAAHRILAAAEAIQRALEKSGAGDAVILEHLDTIFAACSFQDLAGQRIRRAIEHLHLVEGTIAVLASNGARAPIPDLSPDHAPGPELAQGEVDKLFG
jgi:chemotaxis protein CheZ